MIARSLIPPLAALLMGAGFLPQTLEESGFHDAPKEEFAPRYPLWTDGMHKRRWISLPPGTSVDKSKPDQWEFPPGTRAWKEFSRGGERIETRLIERLPDGTWRFSAFAWNEAGTRATLAPEGGIPSKGIPSRADCLACHEGAPSPILGYSAVQLEGALEPALGYLHANCGHCHNPAALPAVDLALLQSAAEPQASAGRTRASLSRLEGRAHAKGVLHRMKSQDPLTRMPPLGVRLVDAEGVALIEDWIRRP